jgi:hypothetical protein
MRHPRSRADDLAALRARFSAQPSAREAGPSAVASARRQRALRRALSEAIAAVDACSSCAKGHPTPHGHWDGGHCCGGATLDIWSRFECATLKLGGTDPAALEPPSGDHAGCAFRGERGCSLQPEDRPSICVRYLCVDLRRELRARDDWALVSRLAAELAAEQRQLAAELGEAGVPPDR